MSNDNKQSLILNIRTEVENISPNVKANDKISKKIIDLAVKSKSEIGYEDSDFIRILDALSSSLEKFIEFNSIREAGNIADIYIDMIEEKNDIPDLITRSKKASLNFFNKKETTYAVIAEDIINRTSNYLENEDKLSELGDLLINTAYSLYKQRIYEQSVAYYERGLNFHIDDSNNEKISFHLTKILETARNLAVKNNEYARNYIELANRVSKDAKIDLKNDPNAQLAYQSYSDHLLKTSKTMVEGRFEHSGRLHKKKRKFSLRKKDEDDEYL